MRRRITVLLAVAAALLLAVPAQAAPPAADPPTGLRSTGATTTTVGLAWNTASGATGYQVLRGTPTTSLAVVATLGAVATYTDTGRSPGTTYVYAVTALRKTKVSAPSAIVTVTTVPQAPTGVTATATSPTSVQVGWASTAGATSYDVLRATGNDPAAKVGGYVAPVGGGQVPMPGWTDTTVSASTAYTYTVVARNASGASASSAGATVTTPAPPAPKLTPAVSVTSSLNPARYGDRVVFTVQVSSTVNGTAVPTGAVQLRLLGGTVNSVLDSTGQATFDWIFNQSNSIVVTAAYQGDTRFDAANGSVTQSVQAAPVFAPYQDFSQLTSADAVVASDVNGDGRTEAVLVTSAYDDGLVHGPALLVHDFVPGDPQPVVARVAAGTVFGDSGVAAAGDLDLDGFGDVVVGTQTGVRVFHGSASGLQPATLVSTSGDVRDVEVADVSGDGRPDLVVSVKGPLGAYVSVLPGVDDGGFGPEDQASVSQTAGTALVTTADLTGDGVAEIVAVWPGRVVEVLVDFSLPDGNWDTRDIGNLPGSSNPNDVAAGDVTGDGLADVVVTAGGVAPSSQLYVVPGEGGGRIGPGYALTVLDRPQALAVADADGDGRRDVVVAHGGMMKLGVLRQTNDGKLAPARTFTLPYAATYAPSAVAVADVTGNALPDLLVASDENGLARLQGW